VSDDAFAETIARYKAAEMAAKAVRDQPSPNGAVTATRRWRDGETVIFDDDAATGVEARWGDRDGNVAWARGEPLLLVGPTGVGKTTLAIQLVGGVLGLWPEVLGLPVEPVERVLYLALDRPRQIERALRRRLRHDAFRDTLRGRLLVWSGPLPADLGREPTLLLDVAHDAHADAVFIDSLKDTTARLADDEYGSNVNRALQHLVAENIDVLGSHHQRKGQDGRRPKTIEDVYGSVWIPAGAGSVILLWGDPGSELVDLEHLKQPAETIGPWKLEHDHHHGTTRVTRGFDALAYLTHHPGATLTDIAAAEWAGTPTDAQRKKTERKLRKLADRHRAHTTGQDRTDGTYASAHWYATTVDTPVDTTTHDTTVDTPQTTVDTETTNP
jgi:replicative DNA helicase